MIKVLGKDANVFKASRGERNLSTWGTPYVYGRLYRKDGAKRASLYVSGQDETGCTVAISANARSLRDAEVMVLAALDRLGLRAWADALVGGAS